jgi:hypothetical protein
VSKTLTITIPHLTNAECGDLAVTAAEGGINYWADTDEYDWTRWQDKETGDAKDIPDDFPFYVIWDKEDNTLPKTAVTPETFRRGMELLMGERYRDIAVARWFASNDRDEWNCADADAADVLIQLGIFGEVVYG